MQLKNILCALFALGIVGTAYAADEIITGGDGTCNADVLGTAENGATANTIATWSLNEYDCPAGQYLMVDGENIACTPCASGSYCPGGIFTVESENKGTNICPTDYTSDEGTKYESACYTQCEQSCFQTSCPQNTDGECVYGNTVTYGREFYGLQSVCMVDESPFCSVNFSCKNGYTKVTSSWTEITTITGSADESTGELVFTLCDKAGYLGVVNDTDGCDVLDDSEWLIKYFDSETKTIYMASVQMVYFDSQILDEYRTKLGLSIKSEEMILLPGILPLESTRYTDAIAIRPYRLAKVTEQKIAEYAEQHNISIDEAVQEIMNVTTDVRPLMSKLPADTSWIVAFDEELIDLENDTNMNAMVLVMLPAAALTNQYGDFVAVYGDIPYSSCDVNKIDINWNPDDGSENITGMCLYGGDVNVPDYIPTKPGYTFKGWKLITQ